MRTSLMPHLPVVVALLALTAVAARGQGAIPSPQERPDLWTTVQDSLQFYLGDSPVPLAPDMQTGSYMFHMPYDSLCTTEYSFTEAWHNGKKLNLRNWIFKRSVNASETMLSFNSGTKDFVVKTGDIVSFFRDLHWFNPVTGLKDTTNYFSRDTLAFAVELASCADMSRLALIDSICVMPQMPPGKPRIYGHRPTMAIASYKIPARMNGDSVFMRIRVYARGSGEYYFTRTDQTTGNYSLYLQHPAIATEIEFLRRHCWTQIPLPVEEDKAEPSIMSVRQAEPGGADASIELAPVPALKDVSVVIHDAYGTLFATPFTGQVRERQTIPYHFTSRGVFIINLLQGGAVLETSKIIVTN